jgi:hypothetical protein
MKICAAHPDRPRNSLLSGHSLGGALNAGAFLGLALGRTASICVALALLCNDRDSQKEVAQAISTVCFAMTRHAADPMHAT